MSTALSLLNNATIRSFTVASGQTATLGNAAILSGADNEVDDAGSGSDLAIGVFLATAAAGARVEVALFGPVVPVLVGTGGATRGTKATLVADGFTNAPAHDSSGATDNVIYGIFMQTGVATDRVGMILCASNRGSA